MADPLHKAPTGILGSLELKVLGKNPDRFSAELAPVADFLDNYIVDRLAPIAPIATLTNPATSVLCGQSVATGEVWRVLTIQAQATVLAADAANTYWATINLTPPGAVVTQIMAVGVMTNISVAGATGTRYFSLVLPHPLWLTPGWRLGVGIFASAAPAVSSAVAMIAMANRIQE